MRELKFRAWDGENREMIDSSFSGYYISFSGKIHNGSIQKELILMQYTGLKDMNGKEIYEGDILYHERQGYCEVIYPFFENVAAFGLKGKFTTNTLDDSEIYQKKGNIYENSYLLTK